MELTSTNVAIFPVDSIEPEGLDGELQGLDPKRFAMCEFVVLRSWNGLRAADGVQAAREAVRALLVSRVSPRRLIVVGHESFTSAATQLQAWEITTAGVIRFALSPKAAATLRQADLEGVVTRDERAGLLHSPSLWHFEAPSGAHTNVFIRVGDLLRTHVDIETMAFWLGGAIPRDVPCIIVDTRSIAAPVYRALHLLNSGAAVFILDGHPEHPKHDPLPTLLAAWNTAAGRPISVVVSVSGTHSLEDSIYELCGQRGEPAPNFIVLFEFANARAGTNALCQLAEDVINYPPSSCKYCDSESKFISVDPSLYYVASIEQQQVPIRKIHTTPVHDFLTRYNDIDDLCQVHHSAGQNHYGYFVDCKKLFSHSEFVARAHSILATWAPPEAVICANRANAKCLGTMVATFFGAELFVLSNDIPSASDPVANELTSMVRVAIVDDILTDGCRIQAFADFVRKRIPGISELRYLIGLARPTSTRVLERVERLAIGHHVAAIATFECAETLLLPAPGECPWCTEQRSLNASIASSPSPPSWMPERLKQLSSVALVPTLLHPNGAVPVRLASGSIIAPEGSNEATVCVAVASCVQRMRCATRADDALHPGFPMWRSFSVDTLDYYSEPMLRGAILRVVPPADWFTRAAAIIGGKLVAGSTPTPEEAQSLGEALLAYRRWGAADEAPASIRDWWAIHFV